MISCALYRRGEKRRMTAGAHLASAAKQRIIAWQRDAGGISAALAIVARQHLWRIINGGNHGAGARVSRHQWRAGGSIVAISGNVAACISIGIGAASCRSALSAAENGS